MNLERINLEKRKLEAKYTRPLRAIFKQMNQDAVVLYRATGNIPAESVAQNYTLEFIKIIRDAMRLSIRKFGFIQRKKDKKFDVEKQIAIFDYQIVKKQILFESTDDELEKIDNEFALLAISFVATESQRQSLFIEETNAKELNKAQQNSIILQGMKEDKLKEQIAKLIAEINQENFNALISGEPVNQKLEKKLSLLKKKLETLERNTKDEIVLSIEEELSKKEESRADLIAQLAVGIAESWAREQEVAILALALGLQLNKAWVTSFINSRDTHIAANGQTVGINEYFTVGGYRAKTPRDPSLPIQELANCHCSVRYS